MFLFILIHFIHKGGTILNVFLLGATGRVGQDILKEALNDRHQVNVLVRSKDHGMIKSDLLTIYEGDALNEVDIMKAMAHYGISWLVTIGTAGILNSRTEPNIYQFQSSELKRRTTSAAEDHLATHFSLKKSNLDWTIVCPTYLPDGDKVGGYRIEVDYIPEGAKSISVGDTASFAYSLLFLDEFIKKRIGISC